MQVKTFKRATSFLTALCMSCSIVFSNAEAVFAYSDKAKATIVNESEHGTLAFAENDFENVYIDSPFETSISEDVVDDGIDETTETQTEDTNSTSEALEDTEIDDASAESSDTEDAVETESIDVTDEVDENTAETEPNEVMQYVRFVDPNSKIINRGQTVIINAYPEDGYSVESIYIVTDSGKAVNYSFNDDVISFTMPGNDVTIRAIFSDTISEFTVDDSLVDNYTYIKSNLDSNYVTLNKWEAVNVINVRQTVVDKSVFDAYNAVPTIDTFASYDDGQYTFAASLINFTTSLIPVFDVDANSNYYVAFVNTMQNDTCDVYDYVVTNNNNNGEVLTDNYYDKNTGILYISKNSVKQLDVTSEDTYVDTLANTQIQLLNVFEPTADTSHNIAVTVSDTDSLLNVQSGIVTCGQYDDTVSFNLSGNSANVDISINGALVGTIDTNVSSSNAYFDYDSVTRNIIIFTNTVSTEQIEFNVYTNENNPNGNVANAAWYDSVTNATFVNGPDIIVDSGQLKANQSAMVNWMAVHVGSHTDDGNTAFGYASYNATQNQTIVNNIVNSKSGDATRWNTDKTTQATIAATGWYTHKLKINHSDSPLVWTVYKGKNYDWNSDSFYSQYNAKFTEYNSPLKGLALSNNGSSTISLNTSDIAEMNESTDHKYDYLALKCVHTSASLSLPTELSTAKDTATTWNANYAYVKILYVDEATKTAVWAIVTAKRGDQLGLGLYKSKIVANGGAFSANKVYNYDGLMSLNTYDKANAVYKLYEGNCESGALDANKLIATFTTNTSGVFDTVDISNSNYSSVKYSTENGKLIFGKDPDATNKYTLPAGTYTLVEDSASSGYNVRPERAVFAVEDGKVTDLAGKPGLNEYPTVVAFNGIKLDNFGSSAYVKGATFYAYYSDEPFTLDVTANNFGAKNAVKVATGTDVYRIAKFVANENGILVPTTIEVIKANSDGEFDESTATTSLITTNNKSFPSIKDSELFDCPLGYYKFVETLAPIGYTIERNSDGSSKYYCADIPDKPNISPLTRGAALVELSAGETERYVTKYAITDKNGTKSAIGSIGRTFKATDRTMSISAQKSLSRIDVNDNGFNNNRHDDRTEAEWNDLFNRYVQGFGNRYSLAECEFKLFLNSRMDEVIAEQLDASGNTFDANTYRNAIATGISKDDGTIIWTITANGEKLGFHTFNCEPDQVDSLTTKTYTASGNCVDGFMENDQYLIYEVGTNDTTIISNYTTPAIFGTTDGKITYGHHTHIVGSEITQRNAALKNGPETVKVGALKESVNLSAGDKLHENTVIHYSNGNENKTITAAMLSGGEYSVSNEDVSNGAYLMPYSNNIVDARNYFIGTTLEIWFNSKLTNENYNSTSNGGWPTITQDNSTTQHVNAGSNGSCAVKVATITYIEENGQVKVKATPEEFECYDTNGNDKHVTYIGSLGYRSQYGSSIYDQCWIDLLPYGAYMMIETKTAPNAVLGDVSNVQYKYIAVDGGNDSICFGTFGVRNYTASNSVSLNLVKSSNAGIDNLSGAEYLVYWSPNKITNNAFGLVTANSNSTSATYNPTSNLHLVGKFTTLTENFSTIGVSGDRKTHNTYGVVTANIFEKNTWSANGWVESNANLRLQLQDTIDFINDNTTYIPSASNNYFDAVVTPASNLTASFSTDFAKKNVINFNGPIGHYVVVEVKAPAKYKVDTTIHNTYIDTTTTASLRRVRSNDIRINDPLAIKIVKRPDEYGYAFKSTTGTQFRVAFYDGVLNINKPEDLAGKGASIIAYYTAKDYQRATIKGEDVWIGAIDTKKDSPTRVIGTDREKYLVNGKLELPEGTVVVTEYRAVSPYYIDESDTYKYGSYDFGHTLIFRHSWDNGVLTKQLRANNYTTWVPYTTAMIQNGTTISNGQKQYPFELDKYVLTGASSGPRPYSQTFKLTATDSGLDSEWTFTVTGGTVYKSLDHATGTDTFADVNGKPFIEGVHYRIEEIESTGTNRPYLLPPVNFVYTPGMSLADVINGNSDAISSNNKVYNYTMPEIRTNAIDPSTLIKAANISKTNPATVTIRDTVIIDSIVPNNTYIIEGIAVDVTDPAHPTFLKDASGNYIRASAAFNVAGGNGQLICNGVTTHVDFTFAYDKSIFEGKTINFYEYLAFAKANNGSEYAYTNYVNGSTTELSASETPSSGQTKQLMTNLLSVDNSGRLMLTNRGLIQTSDKTGYICHANPADEAQNIHFPSVKTLESDLFTETHMSGVHDVYVGGTKLTENTISVVDKVTIKNLPVLTYRNKDRYRLTYCVRDYDFDTVLAQDTTLFTCTNANEMTLDLSGISFVCGDTTKFYVQEYLYSPNGLLIASHTDKIQDQTGYISGIVSTTATNTADGSKMLLAANNTQVTDTIQYQNFPVGKSFIAYGFLVNTANDTIVAVADKTFTTTLTDGTVDVPFTFNATNLENTKLVVYEYVFTGTDSVTGLPARGSKFTSTTDAAIKQSDSESGHYRLIGTHYNKNDTAQTVYIPSASTNLNGNAKIVPANATMNLVDTITYNNILQGSRVTVYGYLVDMETNKIIATQRQLFDTPAPAPKTEPAPVSGNIQVVFTVNTSNMANHTISCVEYIYQGNATFTAQTVGSTFSATHAPVSITGGRLIAKHADLADKAQQVKVNDTPKLNVLKTNYTGDPLADATLRIVNADTGATVEEWTSITAPHALSADLNVGNYELVEVRAPKGYTIVNPIKFSAVNDTATVNGVSVRTIKLVYTDSPTEELPYTNATIDGNTVKLYTLTMRDPDLAHLPTAGGIGTTVFSVCGMLMMLGGAYFIFKKKEESAE